MKRTFAIKTYVTFIATVIFIILFLPIPTATLHAQSELEQLESQAEELQRRAEELAKQGNELWERDQAELENRYAIELQQFSELRTQVEQQQEALHAQYQAEANRLGWLEGDPRIQSFENQSYAEWQALTDQYNAQLAAAQSAFDARQAELESVTNAIDAERQNVLTQLSQVRSRISQLKNSGPSKELQDAAKGVNVFDGSPQYQDPDAALTQEAESATEFFAPTQQRKMDLMNTMKPPPAPGRGASTRKD